MVGALRERKRERECRSCGCWQCSDDNYDDEGDADDDVERWKGGLVARVV